MLGTLDTPDGGDILFDGELLFTNKKYTLSQKTLAKFRNRKIGFVFQFHHLLPAFSALENVMLPGLMRYGAYTREVRTTAVKLLTAVGLEAAMHKPPNQLSGGMQQRVAIARALALSPRLVLADEPTGNLDTHSADEVFALMREINKTQGAAFLMVTHDPRLAARCDRVIEMRDGTIVADAPRQP